MKTPCKHGHFDGAMHDPCYQCRSEAYADDIAELEKMVVRANKREAGAEIVARKARAKVALETNEAGRDWVLVPREPIERILNKLQGKANKPIKPAEAIAMVRELAAAMNAAPEPIQAPPKTPGVTKVDSAPDAALAKVMVVRGTRERCTIHGRLHEGCNCPKGDSKCDTGRMERKLFGAEFTRCWTPVTRAKTVAADWGKKDIKDLKSISGPIDKKPGPRTLLQRVSGTECSECPAGDCLGCPRKPPRWEIQS